MNRIAKGGVAMLLVATVLLGSLAAALADEPQPEIYIPKMRHDFGDVYEQQTFEYSFVVRNKGKADLIIESVKPGWGCTVAKFDKVIPSGQEGKIHMVIEGKRVHDRFNKSATIRSNDPEHPVMTISMAGNITPYVSIVPKSRVYLQGKYGEKVEKKLTVKSNEDDLEFKITKIESNIDDKITYDYAPTAENGTWEISIYKNPRLPTLSTYGNLTVYTNSEKAPTKTVQVQVITKGAITVEPKAVNFGTIKFGSDGEPGKAVTKNVVVIKTTGDFSIKDLQFSTDKFVGEIESVQPGRRYNIKVTFSPPIKKQPRQTHVGEMTILTDDPREPELKVRLVARSM